MSTNQAETQPKRITISELLKRAKNQPPQGQIATTSASSSRSGIGPSRSEAPSTILQANATEQEVANREPAPEEEILNYDVPLAPLMWNLDRKFETKKELEDFLGEEDCWSTRTSIKLKNGHKTLYRCNKVIQSGPQCAAELYVLYQIIIDDVQIIGPDAPDTENVIGGQVVAEENIVEENSDEANTAVNTDTEPNAAVPQSNEENPAAKTVDDFGKHIFKVYRLNRMLTHEEMENQTPTKVKPYVKKLILDLSKDFKPNTIFMK